MFFVIIEDMENGNIFKEKYEELKPFEQLEFEGENFEGIKLNEMKELVLPLREIVFKIKEKIKEGKYTTIIGDDASGRVPALILYRLLKEIYKSSDQNINALFLAGSRKTEDLETKKRGISDFLKSRLTGGEKVLVVTELIHRGSSLLPVTEVLQKLQIEYDVTTVGILKKSKIGELEEKLSSEIIYGEQGKPSIDGNYVIAGVKKSYDELSAKRHKMTTQERQTFLDARSDVEVITKKLFEYYKSII